MVEPTPLEVEIGRLIRLAGPMPVAQYMELCLAHPRHGYYMARDPLGLDGDFTTAPEITQMFGEIVGLWAAAVWRMIGSPQAVNLVELGPGRGTLMADALRAARIVPGFANAIRVHLVETSPALRERQRQTLAGVDIPIAWHDELTSVPHGLVIIAANEFFDALPVHQAVRLEDGWHERTVEIGADGKLVFGVAPDPLPSFEQTLPARLRAAPSGAIFEWRSHRMAFEIGRRCARGGAALLIDYGHKHGDVGDTFQAVARHRYADPLAIPGFVDLTAHVDFEALGTAAAGMGARVHGPIEQAVFLRRLGIEKRAAALKAKAPPEKAAAIDSALERLLEAGRTGMGELFKVIALSHRKLARLPGFDADARAPAPAAPERAAPP
ncbi:MAG TPA: SAM-dependent methyltransferase [Xanthobacteraceae bacterium]